MRTYDTAGYVMHFVITYAPGLEHLEMSSVNRTITFGYIKSDSSVPFELGTMASFVAGGDNSCVKRGPEF